jgi:uncharacterized membrane protein
MEGERIWQIDALRGTAVVLMAAYHLFFDLNYLGILSLDVSSIFFVLFQRIIAVLFLGVVGISLAIGKKTFPENAKRAAFLAAVAAGITIATAVYPGYGAIYFGIIHFIAIAVFFGYFFREFGELNLLFSFAILAIWFVGKNTVSGSAFLIPFGFPPADFYTLDYFPLLPWFAVVLLGIWLGKTRFWGKIGSGKKEDAKKICWVGRHALAIYLMHQPVLLLFLTAAKILLQR